jgi:cell division protein FtsI/penicillin-binding protein 2
MVFAALLVAFAAMATRLIVLQTVDARAYDQLASKQRKREILFPPRRGTIFDRDGEPLAISVDLQTVYADPALVDDPEAEAAALAPVLGEGRTEIEERLRGTRPGSRFEYLARQVEPKVSKQVRELDLAGVYMKPESRRYYPNGKVAAHVLGFADVDGRGVAGVERQYEDILEGRPGRMVLEQDPAGNPLPQAEFTYEQPKPGRSLLLTIDKDLQYFTQLALQRATKAYNAKAATAVIMRPDTGEILTLANVPDFDPNDPGEFAEESLRNRAATDVFEPGSIFKLVTASGALEERVVTPRSTFVVPDSMPYADRVFNDSHSHATEEMTVAEIIEDSSNVGTIQVGLKLGGEKLDEYVRRFGFGASTGLDFPGESPGIVLDRDEWSGSTIATIPIGQGIAVTALQMTAAYATLANNGVWVEPKLLAGTMGSEGKVVPSTQPAIRRVVSANTARQMTRILTSVVDSGTGVEAQVPGYRVAGKTGTAQKPLETGGYGNEYIASFAGYAPATDPEIVIVISFDEPSGTYGGVTAAPTFSTIAEFALRRLGVPPTGGPRNAARDTDVAEEEAAPVHD